jgi:hypothetical protein
MPLGPGVRYRWKTYPSGRKVRLAFKNGTVVEAKSDTGKVHTPAEFKQDRLRQKAKTKKLGRR